MAYFHFAQWFVGLFKKNTKNFLFKLTRPRAAKFIQKWLHQGGTCVTLACIVKNKTTSLKPLGLEP